jgi:hypothetical protein
MRIRIAYAEDMSAIPALFVIWSRSIEIDAGIRAAPLRLWIWLLFWNGIVKPI